MQQMIVFNACIGGMLLPIKLFHAGKAPSEFLNYAFSILIAHTLYSGIRAYLSSAALVSQFALPSGKWKGIHASAGDVLVPTLAVDSICQRLEETLTLSPFLMPSFSASTIFISMNDLPSISIRPGVRPVIALVV